LLYREKFLAGQVEQDFFIDIDEDRRTRTGKWKVRGSEVAVPFLEA